MRDVVRVLRLSDVAEQLLVERAGATIDLLKMSNSDRLLLAPGCDELQGLGLASATDPNIVVIAGTQRALFIAFLRRQAQVASEMIELDEARQAVSKCIDDSIQQDRDVDCAYTVTRDVSAHFIELTFGAHAEIVNLYPPMIDSYQAPDAKAERAGTAATALDREAKMPQLSIIDYVTPSVLNCPVEKDYFYTQHQRGASAIYLSAVLSRIAIIDRRLLLISQQEDYLNGSALIVRSLAAVESIRLMLLNNVTSAVQLESDPSTTLELRSRVLSLLARGLTDEAIARVPGRSVRSVAQDRLAADDRA